MDNKKTIALCISGTQKGVHDDIIAGVFEYCKSRDINVCMYTSLLLESEYSEATRDSMIINESMPFQLVDFDNISGLIIAGASIASEAVKKELVRRARMKNLPVVSIEDENTTGCFHVNIDDEEGMEQIVSHVVEEHGLTRVNFLGGIPGNRESENRLRAYKRVLEKNLIPVDESRIGFGYFGDKADEVLESFFDGSHEKPQAIICANDLMAIKAISFITERGYSVPADITVTGFDGIDEAMAFCPAITTARRGMKEAGEEAVKVIMKILAGKQVSLDTTIVPAVVYGQSCGCQPIYPKHVITLYKYEHGEMEKHRDFFSIIAALLHCAASHKDVESYIHDLEFTFYSFKIRNIVFCMADEAVPNTLTEGEVFVPYPDRLKIVEAFGMDELKDRYIKPGEIPREISVCEEIAGISFVPIYFLDRALGYAMLCHSDMEYDRELFKKWFAVLSSQLGVIYETRERHHE